MRNLFWGITLVLIGVLLLLDNLGYASFDELLHDYWPLLLVWWGGWILFRKRSVPEVPPQPAKGSDAIPPSAVSPSAVPPPAIPEPGGPSHVPGSPVELIHQSQVFGDLYNRVTSQNFKGGSLSTIFGDCILDLSSATIADGEHELRIHGVFGSSVIILPPEAAVSIAASSIFGSLTILGQHRNGVSVDLRSDTPSFASKSNRLTISVSSVFGSARVN
jgi:hypothetical protein